jgi:hypothetical protein
MRQSWASLLALGIGSPAAPAWADPPVLGQGAVPIFTIAKSENKNEVQYVVRVDSQCAPTGPEPVFAYWLMLERGPRQTAPILPLEVAAYGLVSQRIIASDANGGQVRAQLKALPARPLIVTTSRASDGTCHALGTVDIAGAPAHLFNVYVHLTWYGLDYILMQGWSLDRSLVVREKITK